MIKNYVEDDSNIKSSNFVDTSTNALASPSTNEDSVLHLNELIEKVVSKNVFLEDQPPI